ncbi:MAG: chemotaxis protein MotB [Kiritimatiellia bacterium]|jgi:chemotaxis protein MotB
MVEEEEECECPAGLPAWMATFADLMSLLMCFFVLLLSFSEMDAMKFKRLAGSMAQAFGVQNILNVVDVPKGTSVIAKEFSPGIPSPTPINEIWQKTEDITEMSLEVQCSEEYDVEAGDIDKEAGVQVKIKQKLEELIRETKEDARELANDLREQIVSGEIEIETDARKIVVRIREQGSFQSGSHIMNDDYYDVMDDIRAVLLQKPGQIQVQGHTDNVPIRSARYRSNWELSAARAVSVAEALMGNGKVDSRRFEVSGFADTKPLADNKTALNRARNRRVEIVIRQGLGEDISDEEKEVIKTDGQDVMRDLDIDPSYLFDLQAEDIF